MDVPSHFHFCHQRLVEFHDTDLAGIVHFANFLRYVESAEHAFFRSLGLPVPTTAGTEQHGWPRLEVTCRYLKPARFEQTLRICLRVEKLGTTSLTYGFWVFGPDSTPHTPIAAGVCSIIHVALDTTTHQIRKAPIPAALRHALENAAATPISPT